MPARTAAVAALATLDPARARRIVAAFEAARSRGEDRAEVEGALIEVPTYANMKRLLARAGALSAGARGRTGSGR